MPNQDLNPSNGRQGSSYLYNQGTSPNTRTAVSQKIRILTPSYGATAALGQIGVLSSFDVSMNKNVEAVRGIGMGDKISELVPSVTEPATASVSRAMLYTANLWQATGYASGVSGPVRSLAHHQWPFDIEMQLVFSTLVDDDFGAAGSGFSGTRGAYNGGVAAIQYPSVTAVPEGGPTTGGHTALITLHEACWWGDFSYSVAADSGIIMESGSCTITDIHDFSSTYGEFLSGGNNPTIGQIGSVRYGSTRTGGGGF